MEIPFFRLMPYQIHSEITAKRTAKKGQQQQYFFGYTPLAPFRFPFVHRVGAKGDKAHER
jgi:hypothetical protein